MYPTGVRNEPSVEGYPTQPNPMSESKVYRHPEAAAYKVAHEARSKQGFDLQCKASSSFM